MTQPIASSTNVYYSYTSDVSSESFFSRLNRITKSPMEAIEGGVWSTFLISDFVGLYYSIKNHIQIIKDPAQFNDTDRKIFESKKQLVFSTLSTTASTAAFLTWANRVRLIFLEALTPFVAGIGYGMGCCISGLKIWDFMQVFNEQSRIVDSLDYSAAEKRRAVQMQTLHLLKIAVFMTFIFWGIFGIITLCFGPPACLALIEMSLLVSSIGFFVGETIYRTHIRA